jgi:hypothetical protein
MKNYEFKVGDLVRIPRHIRQSLYRFSGEDRKWYQFGVVTEVKDIGANDMYVKVFWPEIMKSFAHFTSNLVRIK